MKTIQFRPDYIRELFSKKCHSKGVDYSGIEQFFTQNLIDNLETYMEVGLTRLTSEDLPDLKVMLSELRSNLANILD